MPRAVGPRQGSHHLVSRLEVVLGVVWVWCLVGSRLLVGGVRVFCHRAGRAPSGHCQQAFAVVLTTTFQTEQQLREVQHFVVGGDLPRRQPTSC